MPAMIPPLPPGAPAIQSGPLLPSDTAAVEEGMLAAAADEMGEEDAKKLQKEEAEVRKWLTRIQEAREFDKPAFREMAINRSYAAGFTSYEVSVNLIGSSIDTMKSFLYAKDPDVSCSPAKQVLAPMPDRPIPPPDPIASLPPQLQQQFASLQADPGAMDAVMADPAVASIAGPLLQQHEIQVQEFQAEQQAWQAEMQARKLARQTRKLFGESLEVVMSKTWKLADMKGNAKLWIGGGLTTTIGWLKCSWHEDLGLDPETDQRLPSTTDNVARIGRLRENMADGYGDKDRLGSELAEQLVGMNAGTEVSRRRGMVIDYVFAEDMTFPIGVTRIAAPVNSPWIDHRLFMRYEDACIAFPDLPKDVICTATKYTQRKPRVVAAEDTPVYESADEPGQFTQGADGTVTTMTETTGTVADGNGCFVCVHEIWDKDANIIRTMIEGVKRYAKPPRAPEIATTRFYPFFAFAPIESDGQRYPQSLVYRSHKLQDEYNGRITSLKRQRGRAKQGILGNATLLDKDEADKVKVSVEGEITYLHTVNGAKISDVFMEKPVVRLDPALYETDSIRRQFEELWGVQQALQGSIDVSKTATEADIQQQGFSTKIGYIRDALEMGLNEIAVYTAEIVLQRLTPDDAREIAGPGAVWPDKFTPDDLPSLVDVGIRAGSTGKPNTAVERQAWATTMPLLQSLIMQVGQLRQSDPAEIADKLEELAGTTLQLSGSHMDIESIMPQESGGGTQQPQPQPQQPGMPPPQGAAPPGPDPMPPTTPGPPGPTLQ